jgi:hypothetical protein
MSDGFQTRFVPQTLDRVGRTFLSGMRQETL